MNKICLLALLLLVGCGKDGAAGAAGATGPQGPPGNDGADGTDNRIVASIGCIGTVTGLTGAAGAALNNLDLRYQAVVTSSGDVYAAASTMNPSVTIGSTSFFSSQQAGAATAPVIFVDDYATVNGGWWNVSLNRSTLVVTAVYTDSSLGADSPVTITFASSACTANSF